MTKLIYKLTNDVLFKMLFVKYPDLLKKLISQLINIKYEDIHDFEIRNPDIPPHLKPVMIIRIYPRPLLSAS